MRKINLLEDINLLIKNEELTSKQLIIEDRIIKLSCSHISKGNFYFPLNRNYKVISF